jgi:hypothetical protein
MASLPELAAMDDPPIKSMSSPGPHVYGSDKSVQAGISPDQSGDRGLLAGTRTRNRRFLVANAPNFSACNAHRGPRFLGIQRQTKSVPKWIDSDSWLALGFALHRDEGVKMAENESCSKWAPDHSSRHRQGSRTKESLLRGEKNILELISMGAPLSGVLNKLCAIISLQIGDVVSVILPTDEQDLHAIMQDALQFGLHVFWSASVPLRNEDVLGTFQMYCCVPRSPTPFELQLIVRVTHLAALAIRRHNNEQDFERFCRNWMNTMRRDTYGQVYLN